MIRKPQKITTQRNHDGCTLPPGLEPLAEEPLHILVAIWCMRQGGWVNRNDIAHAFEITPQRATFQFSYLTHRPEVVRCEVRRARSPGSPNDHYEVRVYEVNITCRDECQKPLRTRKSGPQRSRVGNADPVIRENLRLLWPTRNNGDK